MKRILFTICILTAFVFSLISCSPVTSQEQISNALGIDVSSGKEVSHYDTHSGNGDGTTCIVLYFNDNGVLKQISENPAWKAFPLDQTVTTLVYGVSDETVSNGPYLTDNEGRAIVPEILNGYYFLNDRQAKSSETMHTELLQRNSFNFTLALYDTDKNTLYFCQLDT